MRASHSSYLTFDITLKGLALVLSFNNGFRKDDLNININTGVTSSMICILILLLRAVP